MKEGKKSLYSPELRTFALTLKFYLSKAYRYVRKVFKNLSPAPSTIRKWYQVIDGSPGFNKESMNSISLRASKRRIPINLVVDEMSIRRQLLFKNSKQYGQVNLGSNVMLEESADNLPEARSAFVLMAVALNAGWKIPVAYFLIDSLTAQKRANLLKISLELLHEAKADVYSLTDGAYVNISMAEILGANFSFNHEKFQSWFLHPITKNKIFIMPDPSHSIKLARNTLTESLNLKDDPQEDAILWNDACSLVYLQEKLHTYRHSNN